ncbi:MAG: threonine--tRNA ligase [Methanomicrobiales archaeon]|nr:threonine--tRNA ligase [Methanomicrobiales archaeon]
MRLLLIHSDYIEYEALTKTPMAEDTERRKDILPEALVAFCAVEEEDVNDIGDVVRQAVQEIALSAERVQATNVMLYPYAHLSSDLAPPDVAQLVLRSIEEGLNALGTFTVKRAPFGWYKSFRISCKGHPLSELSRQITPGGEEEAKKEKSGVTHDFFVMTPDGELHDTEDFIDDSPFGALLKKELGLPVPPGGDPIHVELMRSKELVDYEAVSDVGHLRWMPRGKLVRDLLADYVLQILLPYGAMPVETPVMYDLDDQAICEHAAKFGERQYRFKSGTRNMMLRFAACFGMFSIMRDMHISPNTLPMKMYELSTYSFRHEQKGEVIGLKRLRAFTMPDMHTLCSDMDEALQCFEEQLRIGFQTGRDFQIPYVSAIRCTRDFYEQYAEWMQKVVRETGEPILLEILSERVHYWVAKIDLAAIDGQGRPIENPTVQIDVESSTRFDIKYHKDGNEIHPPILHCSPTGSVERVICALLENTAAQKVPSLPTWLSPTQVRLIPIADRHIGAVTQMCDALTAATIRTDIDDREESVNRKVRLAGTDWVPYVAVIGDREAAAGTMTVTIRKKSEPEKPFKQQMTIQELVAMVREDTAGMPVRPLYTPRKLSVKPRFI